MNFKKIHADNTVISYLFFGVCTTLVNYVAYWVAAHQLRFSTMPSTIIAWLLAVLFAYSTNRKWVFHSEASGFKALLQEISSFYACRLATGVVDWLCMFVFVDLLAWNDMVIKLAANVLVIFLNYVASKLVIFRKGKPGSG